jgi:hypothetical protein
VFAPVLEATACVPSCCWVSGSGLTFLGRPRLRRGGSMSCSMLAFACRTRCCLLLPFLLLPLVLGMLNPLGCISVGDASGVTRSEMEGTLVRNWWPTCPDTNPALHLPGETHARGEPAGHGRKSCCNAQLILLLAEAASNSLHMRCKCQVSVSKVTGLRRNAPMRTLGACTSCTATAVRSNPDHLILVFIGR